MFYPLCYAAMCSPIGMASLLWNFQGISKGVTFPSRQIGAQTNLMLTGLPHLLRIHYHASTVLCPGPLLARMGFRSMLLERYSRSWIAAATLATGLALSNMSIAVRISDSGHDILGPAILILLLCSILVRVMQFITWLLGMLFSFFRDVLAVGPACSTHRINANLTCVLSC
ncbi:hypothetical protein B0H10DRAFT_1061131 [Mycena sp. CBHHK59/15]|nr:hypothetical protein B0H10DRAFT_1061131 [Mycena sp. CBHHK59/15]